MSHSATADEMCFLKGGHAPDLEYAIMVYSRFDHDCTISTSLPSSQLYNRGVYGSGNQTLDPVRRSLDGRSAALLPTLRAATAGKSGSAKGQSAGKKERSR